MFKHRLERRTFAVGHLALGYITGKGTSRLLHVDILIPGLRHRGPTHSLVIIFILFLMAFVLFERRAAPYFIAMVQHAIIGDYLTSEGIQLLWPVTLDWYGIGIMLTSPINILLEWVFFLTSLALMIKAKDAWILIQSHPSNLLLSIPVFTVLLPVLLSFPFYAPLELIIPHLTYLAVFAFSILIDLKSRFRATPVNRFK